MESKIIKYLEKLYGVGVSDADARKFITNQLTNMQEWCHKYLAPRPNADVSKNV
jgi:hypothetical protein